MRKKLSTDKQPGVFIKMLNDYVDYIIVGKGFSPHTKTSYKQAYRLLLQYIWDKKHISSEKITFDMLDISLIEDFLKWLENSLGNKFNTRNNRLAAIRSFAKYAVNHDFEAASKFYFIMSKIEAKKGLPEARAHFTTEEVRILIDLPKLNTKSGRRNATIFIFMFASGCRAQELCNLQVKNIDFRSDGHANVSFLGKGRKRRNITIAAEVAFVLKKYMKYRGIMDVPEAYVFNTQNRPQMSVSCLEEIYSKYINQAKTEYPSLFQGRYSPHSMRHTTAISMLASGVPLAIIRVFLGHEHISTTEIYATITQSNMDDALKKWNESFWQCIAKEKNDEEIIKDSIKDVDNVIPDFLK